MFDKTVAGEFDIYLAGGETFATEFGDVGVSNYWDRFGQRACIETNALQFPLFLPNFL
jgi:hypothetical protein